MTRETARTILQSMITLASAALGLVAALAWNDAIRETITRFIGSDDSLSSKYLYAVLATILAVVVILVLARLAARVGGDAAISREADG